MKKFREALAKEYRRGRQIRSSGSGWLRGDESAQLKRSA